MYRKSIGNALRVFCVLALGVPIAVLWSAPSFACQLDTLAPGHWCKAPDNTRSTISSVLPSPVPVGDNRPGRPESIIDEWSSGGYDTVRDRLIVWGGGHNNYSGNEVYAFDINTFEWQRLSNPSTNVGGSESSGYYPDGLPRSRHTYDYLEYVPSIDRFCSLGGAAQFPSGGIETNNVDCFNFGSNTWESFYKKVPKAAYESSLGAVSAYDSQSGNVFLHTTSIGGDPHLLRWEPATDGTDNWEVLTDYDWIAAADDRVALTGALDPEKRYMVAIGSGNFYLWDLADAGAGVRSPTRSGPRTAESDVAPGLAYDTASKKIVAWAGGADVYALDCSKATSWSCVWSLHAPAAGNTVTPSAPPSAGTYGRFHYVPSKNVFVVVSSINSNVYFYKLAAGGGTPNPATLQFSAASVVVTENEAAATITVIRSGDSSSAVSVDYATANGSASSGADYAPASGTLSWAAGDATAKTFTVSIVNDPDAELNETVSLTLSNATGGAVIGPQGTATLTIADNDSAVDTVEFSSATYTVGEGAASTTITVIRSGAGSGAVSVGYATANGTATAGADYTAASGTLNWANGQIGSRTFTVPILQDAAVEGAETITLALTSPNGATLGAVSTAVLTVNDDDGGSGPPSEPPPGPPGDPGTGTGQLGGGGPMDPAMLLLLLVGAARLGWSTSVTSSRSAPRFAGLGGDPTRRRPRLSRVDRRCRAATSSGACRDGA